MPRRRRRRGQTRSIQDPELHRRKAARAGREEKVSRRGHEDEPFAVHFEVEIVLEGLRLPREVAITDRGSCLWREATVLQLLEGGDFSHVDEVVKLDLRRLEREARVVADGEVPHGVGEGRARSEQETRNEQAREKNAEKSTALAHGVSSSFRIRSAIGA
jgi:hypothetical protein